MKTATPNVPAPGALAIAFLALALGSPGAWACSCALESDQEMIERSALAVTAQAVAGAPFDVWGRDPGTPLPPPRAVTVFRVERVLRGSPVGERIAVVHDTDSGPCGVTFRAGKRYLLAFATPDGEGPEPLRIGLCDVGSAP